MRDVGGERSVCKGIGTEECGPGQARIHQIRDARQEGRKTAPGRFLGGSVVVIRGQSDIEGNDVARRSVSLEDVLRNETVLPTTAPADSEEEILVLSGVG